MMLDYVSGLVTMAYIVAGLFFLRFWVQAKDGLFLILALAFSLLALEQALLVHLKIPREEETWLYLLRLLAFLFIIAAVVRKNRPRSGRD
jgi:hypothetical protein